MHQKVGHQQREIESNWIFWNESI